MAACAYRTLEPVLVQRALELRELRMHDAPLAVVARRVASRRVSRAVGGAVGTLMGVLVFLVAIASFIEHYPDQERIQRWATLLLLAAWPAALVSGLLARLATRAASSASARLPMTGDPATDLARLERHDPLARAREVALAWERRSVALPLAALSLLAPLTIHWCVYCVPSGGGDRLVQDFGFWIALSGVLVGHAHLALLVSAVRWTGKLCAMPTDEMRLHGHRGWGNALGVSVAIGCLPGVVLFAIPPALIAITGVLFIPFMYVATVRILGAERLALEATARA